MQVMLLSMMEKLSELRSKFEGEAFKLFIGGSTAGNACSMQGVLTWLSKLLICKITEIMSSLA